MADHGVDGGEGLVTDRLVELLDGHVSAERTTDLRRSNRSAAGGSAADVVNQFRDGDAERGLEDAAASDVSRQLEHLGAMTVLRAEGPVTGGAVGQDGRRRGQADHIVDHGRLAPQSDVSGQGRLGPHHATLALEALDQSGLLAADVGAGAHPHVHPEGEPGAENVGAQPAALLSGGDRPSHGAHSVGVLAADVDVSLLGADRPAGDGHSLQQHEGVALHQHAVGEGTAIALIGVGHDIFRRPRRGHHRSPLGPGGEGRSPATAQPAGRNLGDHLLWFHSQCPAQADSATVGQIVVRVEGVDDTDAAEGEPLLPQHPRQLFDSSEAQGVVAPGEHAGGEQARYVGGRHRAVADAPRRSCHLHQGLEPQHAPRPVAHHPRAGFPGEGRSHFVGAGCPGRGIARHVHGHVSTLAAVGAASADRKRAAETTGYRRCRTCCQPCKSGCRHR